MTIAEQIYAIAKTLPQDQADAILTFAEFIRAKHLNNSQTVKNLDELPWSEFVYSLAGTWKDDFPTVEEIRAESGQDILRESL